MPTLDDPSDFGYFRYWYTTFAPWKNNPMKDIVFDVEKYTFPPVGLRPAAHFPMKPDIYTYPENADPRALLQYKIAVEQAALDGRPIEFRPQGDQSAGDWQRYGTQSLTGFSWYNMQYRVARPKIAAGHNPDNLTDEQVGVAEGWRLLTAEEINGPKGPGVEFLFFPGNWQEAGTTGPHRPHNTYRTKAAPGQYNPPKLKQLVPWTLETFRWPDCVRHQASSMLCILGVPRLLTIEEARNNGVFVRASFYTWQQMFEHFECSYDRGASWVRCGTEAP